MFYVYNLAPSLQNQNYSCSSVWYVTLKYNRSLNLTHIYNIFNNSCLFIHDLFMYYELQYLHSYLLSSIEISCSKEGKE